MQAEAGPESREVREVFEGEGVGVVGNGVAVADCCFLRRRLAFQVAIE